MAASHPSLEQQEGEEGGRRSSLECPLCKTRTSCIIHNIDIATSTFQRSYLHCSGSCSAIRSPFIFSQCHYHRLYVYRHGLHDAMTLAIRSQNTVKKRRLNRFNISGNRYVLPWITQELQSLLKVEDVDLISQHVIGVLEYFERREKSDPAVGNSWKETMADSVRPFLDEDAAMFSDELENFLLSGLSVEAYDELTEEIVTLHTLKSLDSIA